MALALLWREAKVAGRYDTDLCLFEGIPGLMLGVHTNGNDPEELGTTMMWDTGEGSQAQTALDEAGELTWAGDLNTRGTSLRFCRQRRTSVQLSVYKPGL